MCYVLSHSMHTHTHTAKTDTVIRRLLFLGEDSDIGEAKGLVQDHRDERWK